MKYSNDLEAVDRFSEMTEDVFVKALKINGFCEVITAKRTNFRNCCLLLSAFRYQPIAVRHLGFRHWNRRRWNTRLRRTVFFQTVIRVELRSNLTHRFIRRLTTVLACCACIYQYELKMRNEIKIIETTSVTQ